MTSVRNLFQGPSKLLVVGGWGKEGAVNVHEVIDLDSLSSKCENLPPLPKPADAEISSYGGHGQNDGPWFCIPNGGKQECFKFEPTQTWNASLNLNITRNQSALLAAPDPPFRDNTTSADQVILALIGGVGPK